MAADSVARHWMSTHRATRRSDHTNSMDAMFNLTDTDFLACSAWGDAPNGTDEMYESNRRKPRDEETFHVCHDASVTRTLCRRDVYLVHRYVKQVYSDAKVCPTCLRRLIKTLKQGG